MRDTFHGSGLVERCVRDLYQLLGTTATEEIDQDADIVMLWDGDGAVGAGANYDGEQF